MQSNFMNHWARLVAAVRGNLTALLFVAGWALFAPASWLGSAQATALTWSTAPPATATIGTAFPSAVVVSAAGNSATRTITITLSGATFSSGSTGYTSATTLTATMASTATSVSFGTVIIATVSGSVTMTASASSSFTPSVAASTTAYFNTPTGFSATGSVVSGTTATMALAWTAPAGSPTGYYVYRATVSTDLPTSATAATGTYAVGTASVIGTPTTASFTDNYTFDGVTVYYYCVAAYNSTVSGTPTASSTVTKMNPVTGVTAVAGTGTGANTIQLSWNAVAGCNRYYLYRTPTSTGAVTLPGTATTPSTSTPGYLNDTAAGTGATTTYTDSGLAGGTSYTYAVSAVLSVGTVHGYTSNPSNAVTVSFAAPTGLSVTGTVVSGTTGPFNLAWTAPVGSPAGYYVYRATTPTDLPSTASAATNPYGGGSGGTGVLVGTPATTTFTDSPTFDGVTVYYYCVCAYNGSYSGVPTASTTVTAMVTVPNLTTAATFSSINLSWTAVAGANRYYIYRSPPSGSTATVTLPGTATTPTTSTTGYLVDTAVGSGATTTYSDTIGLIGGVSYTYAISAVYDVGPIHGFTSTPSTATLLPTPSPVTAVAGTGTGAGSIQLSWTLVPGVDRYYIYRTPTATGAASVPATSVTPTTSTAGYLVDTAVGSGSTTTFTDTADLVPGTAYTYAVSGVLSSGPLHGYSSGASNTVTPQGAFGAPTNLAVTGSVVTGTTGPFKLTWDASLGSVTGYRVYRATVATDLPATASAATSTYSNGTASVAGTSATASFTDSPTFDGATAYYYCVSAYNGTYGGVPSAPSAVTAMVSVPNLTTSATLSSINLSWTAVAGADRYYIYRSPPSGSTASLTLPGTATTPTTSTTGYLLDTAVGSGATTTYSDTTGLIGGVSYTYAISAVYDVGPVHGFTSTPSTAVLLATPNTVTAVAGTGTGAGTIQLSWTQVAGADRYYIYRTPDVNGTVQSLPSTNSTPTTDSGNPPFLDFTPTGMGSLTTYTDANSIVDGTTYTYVVSAVLSSPLTHGYASNPSTPVTATPLAAPASLTVTAGTGATAGTVQISWPAVAGANRYYLYRSSSSATGGSGTGLLPGPTTQPTTSAANWAAFIDNTVANSGVLTYTDTTDTGLTYGSTYYYSVSSVNNNYTNLYSGSGVIVHGYPTAPSVSVTVTALPAPASLTVTAGTGSTAGTIQLSWAPVAGADRYYIYRSTSNATGGSGTGLLPNATANPTTSATYWPAYIDATVAGSGITTYTDTTDNNLVPGTTYYYVVSSVNNSYNSSTNIAHGYPTAPSVGVTATALVAPTNLLAYGSGAGAINLSWTGVAGANRYYIYRSTSNATGGSASGLLPSSTSNPTTSATYWPAWIGDTVPGSGSTTFTDTTVTAGTTYYYVVSSVNNSYNNSANIEHGYPTNPVGGIALAAPASVSATAATGTAVGTIQISWPAVTGANLYYIYRATVATDLPAVTSVPDTTYSSGTGAYLAATVANSGALTYADTTSIPGTTYYYAVSAANNGFSASNPSLSNPTGPSSGAAAALLAPTLSAVGGTGQVVLTWTASAGAVSYNIYRATTTGAEGTTAYASATGTTYTDTGAGSGPLAGGTTYYYTVAAVNSSGTSTQSTEVSALTAPSAPLNLSATASTGQVALSWTAVLGAASYNIYRATTAGAEGTTVYATSPTTTFTDLAVTNGTPYFYTVAGVNPSGTSTQSSEVSATPAVPLNSIFLGTPAITHSGSLGALSYQGNAASNSGSAAGGDSWTPMGTYQDWYTVNLTAGLTYVISMQTTGNSFLSVQDSSGHQVAWNDDAGKQLLGSMLASQLLFTPSASGTYTIICSTDQPGTTLTYTLLIPSPTPNINSITLPYGPTASALGSNSYYGPAAATNMGSPTGGWLDYAQDWYSVSLTAADTYSITMNAAAGVSVILALQDSSGAQVAYSSGTGSTQLIYTPGNSGTYTIICSQNSTTSASTSYTLTIPMPVLPVVTTITITAPSVLSPSNGIVTITVAASGTATPTGTVSLVVDNGAAMTQPLSGGAATFTITSPAFGNHQLTATYSGAVGFQAAQPATGTLSVGVPNVKVVPPSRNEELAAALARHTRTAKSLGLAIRKTPFQARNGPVSFPPALVAAIP